MISMDDGCPPSPSLSSSMNSFKVIILHVLLFILLWCTSYGIHASTPHVGLLRRLALQTHARPLREMTLSSSHALQPKSSSQPCGPHWFWLHSFTSPPEQIRLVPVLSKTHGQRPKTMPCKTLVNLLPFLLSRTLYALEATPISR